MREDLAAVLPGQKQTEKKSRHSKLARREAVWGYLFITPGTVGVIVFTLFPLLFSFVMSFTDWSMLAAPHFLGLENYLELFRDRTIGKEFSNTFVYAFGTAPIGVFVSLVLATLMNTKIRGRSFYRVAYFLPYVSMPAAITIVWQWMLNSDTGIVNAIIRALGFDTVAFMSDPKLIMPVMIFISIWQMIGYSMIILLAGLQNIPQTYYEAAKVDGAGPVKQFFKITIPIVSPTIFFLMIISFINSFKAFDIVYMIVGAHAITGGGPLADASRTVVYGIYERSFIELRMGYAAAEAVILFLIILALTFVQFRLQNKWVHYDD